ncbi:MAG: hypothetical protein HKN87_14980 [Saprospiraceae bacterium]|nr:hypothetical protein [Saprospiraceae bacterium]
METVGEKRRNRNNKVIAMLIAILVHCAAAAALWYSSDVEGEDPIVEEQPQELTLQILPKDTIDWCA